MLLTCAAVLISLFFIPDVRRPNDRFLAAAEDFLHFPLFLAVTLLVLRGRPGRIAERGWGVRTVAGLAFATVCIEVIQPFLGRTGQWTDALLGMLGIAAGCMVHARHGCSRSGSCLGIILVLGLIACAPMGGVALDRFRARREFPVLASFESALELGRWEAAGCRVRRVALHPAQGCALEMKVKGEAAYPGVFLKEMPAGWAGYARLCCRVDLRADGGALLWLRIDDRLGAPYSDRFQQSFRLEPGFQRVCVDLVDVRTPGGRRLDLDRIQTMGFFLENACTGDTFRLDEVVLERP